MRVVLKQYVENEASEPLRRRAAVLPKQPLVWLVATDDNRVWFETIFADWPEGLAALSFATAFDRGGEGAGASWCVTKEAALILVAMATEYGARADLAISTMTQLRDTLREATGWDGLT